MNPSHPVSFQWHPDVHTRWGESRLQFWFLSYRTVYERRAYVRGLEELFTRLGIVAYTLYELKGGYDLLVRVWLPHTVRSADLEDELYELENLTLAEPFKVQDVLRHWPWRNEENGSYEMLRPEATHLDAGAQVLDLRALNQLNEQAIVTQLQEDRARPGKMALSRRKLAELLAQYCEAKLVVRPRYRHKGIKFVILVTVDPQRRNRGTLKAIGEELAKTLDEACDMKVLNEASLYFGQGVDNARYLILGRTPYARYHEVNQHLLDRVNRLMATQSTRTRSYDMVAAEFASHRELLPTTISEPPEIPDDVRALLAEDESQTFEVKAAGLTNMDRWIKGDGRQIETKEAIGRVGRAIVALLNSDGGVVLLGALEESKFPKGEDRHGRLKARSALRSGTFLAIGVDHEIERRGGWDPYVLHLRRQLLHRIGGDADFWVGPFEKRLLKVSKSDTRTLVLIPIRKPDRWFSLDDEEFVVRRGPESAKLNPNETQQWIRVTGPRGGWRTPGG